MVNWIQSVFLWLGKQITPWLNWLWDLIKKQAVVLFAVIAAILAPISWALTWWVDATFFVYEQTGAMFSQVESLNVGEAASFWGALGQGAALMNCIVALDYGIAVGTIVLGFMIMVYAVKGVIWLIKLLPFF